MIIDVASPGRLCLYGENADWLGGSVVTVAVNRGTRVHASCRPGPASVEVNFPLPFPAELWPERPAAATPGWFAAVARASRMDPVTHEVSIRVSGTLPTSGGFGSSASLCTALAAVVAGLRGGPTPGAHELADVAFRAERSMDVPCGPMDQFAIAIGGLLVIDCVRYPPVAIPHVWPADLAIVIGHSSTEMRFADFAGTIRHRQEQLHEYGRRSRVVVEEFAAEVTLESIIDLIARGHQDILQFLGPVDPGVQRAVDAAVRAGAFAAKSAGARRSGGGMFAVCEVAAVTRVRDAISAVGLIAAHVTPDVGTRSVEQ